MNVNTINRFYDHTVRRLHTKYNLSPEAISSIMIGYEFYTLLIDTPEAMHHDSEYWADEIYLWYENMVKEAEKCQLRFRLKQRKNSSDGS